MGCCHSRFESKEAVSRCKARRRYTRQLSEGRQAFAAAHSLYLHSLRSTGAALLQFANGEAHLQHRSSLPSPSPPSLSLPHPPRPPSPSLPHPRTPSPPLSQPPPPLSPSSETWTSSFSASSVLLPPPPPPPPPPHSSSPWDFWDPFAPSSSHSVTEEEWEEAATTISEVTAAPAAIPPPSVVSGFSKDCTVELSVVTVSKGKKEISEIVQELDVYFTKASEAGARVSVVLEAPSSGSVSFSHGVSGKLLSLPCSSSL